MRILFLNHSVIWHTPRRPYFWAKYLSKKGHDVTILTISKSRKYGFEYHKWDGVLLVETPDLLKGRLRSGWDAWDVINRIMYIIPKRYDIVHSIDSRPVDILPALLMRYLNKAKLIIDWGDWWGRGGTITERSNHPLEKAVAPVETFFEEAFRKFADGTVVLTEALKKRAVKLGAKRSNILKLNPGADVDDIIPRSKKDARFKLGVENKDKILGYVGTILNNDKDLLIQSMRIAQQIDPEIQLYLIGHGFNLGNLDGIKNLYLTGELSNKEFFDFISVCDYMLLPLKKTIANIGRWPFKIGDYLAAGKPVIATRVGDYYHIIEQGKCGIISNDNPEDFAAKILESFQGTINIEEMGNNARRVAEQRLNWRNITDILEKFYMKILLK